MYNEQDLKREITEQYTLAKRFLDPIHEKMNKQEELYRSYIDKGNSNSSAMVFDPRIFRVIETVTPRMVANEPTGTFYPREESDTPTAQILGALLRYDWQQADMFEKLVKFVKGMLIFGTAFGRTYWDFEEDETTRMIPKEINGRLVWTYDSTEKIKIVKSDRPNFEVLNIYDCYFDPNATNIDDMRWFIYRRFKTLEELEAENETRGGSFYKNLDKIKKQMKGKKGDITEDMGWREHRRTMLQTEEFKGEDESNPDLVVLRRFTKKGWCDYLPEYDEIIREIENPYFHRELPIIYGVDYVYPNELLGMGEIEPIDRIQRAINAVLNQRLDNVELTLNNMWKIRKGGGVDLHTLVSKPGNVVTTDDMSAVEPLTIPDVTGSTFVQTMNYLTSALQNGSGITDYTMGVGQSSSVANKTATGVRLVQQEANAQFKLKIQLFTKMVIERIANQWKDLRIQYTTEEQMLRIVGKDLVKYLKEETKLQVIGLDGEEILPGDFETPTKLTIGPSGEFAFLKLMPEDIQPHLVGNYDFIARVSSESVNDPISMQENFFVALDRISTPAWTQGLQSQNKQLDFEVLTAEILEKLNYGINSEKIVIEMKKPEEEEPEGEISREQMEEGLNQNIDPITGQDMNEPIV